MKNEIWDLYDWKGNRTPRTMIRGEEVPAGYYHLAVHIWPVNSCGEYLVQRRASTVSWNPNMWAVTGGSAVSGETPMMAALRELHEEIGYQAKPEELSLIACLRRTNSFCNVFTLKIDQPEEAFVLQKEEVSMVRWCDQQRIQQMISDNVLYNYGDSYFRMLFDFCKNKNR